MADTPAPIPTYILGWESEGQATKYSKAVTGGDLCDNISFLGKRPVQSVIEHTACWHDKSKASSMCVDSQESNH